MLKTAIAKYKETTNLNRFLIKGGVLYLVWRVFRKWLMLRGQYTNFTNVVADVYVWIAKTVLMLFGADVSANFDLNCLWIADASNSIRIVYDCLGINLLFIFTIFILAYPGKIKIKFWFIPMGIIFVFLMNAFRIAALTAIVAQHPEKMDFYHHFVFQGVLYLFIFGLWWWFTKLNRPMVTVKKNNE